MCIHCENYEIIEIMIVIYSSLFVESERSTKGDD